MSTRLTQVVLATVFVAGLAALPACNKQKKFTGGGDGPIEPPSGYGGSKGGPPPGFFPPAGNTDPSLPTPPGPGPLFTTGTAVSRTTSQANLQQIGVGFHNAHDALGVFPQGVADKSGKIGLSWRVALLPFIGEGNLYKQFKLDEPWDSEHNKKLIAKMPKVYAPGSDTNGYTYYRSFTGANTVMPPPAQQLQPGQVVPGVRITSITDGTANTLLVAEATEPVIWTKPDELAFKPGQPPKVGGGVFGNGFCAVRCDGSTVFVAQSIDGVTLSNAIQINDGNVVVLP